LNRRILIVGPAWVGDLVMMQALVAQLAATHPGAEIDLLVPAWASALAGRMPGASQVFGLSAGHGQLGLAERWRLARRLRDRRHDWAIVTPRSFKAALVPWLAGIPRRTGYATEFRLALLNDRRPLDRARLDQTVKRLVALGLPPGAPLPENPRPRLRIDPGNLARLRERLPCLAAAPLVALLPGAAHGPAKRWPAEKFRELAAALVARGATVLVLGSAGERPLGEVIAAADPGRVHNLCGDTGLDDVADLLSLVCAAVSNDSGLMHVAAAAGAHVVGIYGSSSPQFTPPLTPARTVCWLGLDCSPCFARECPLGHLRCLNDLEPARVLAAVEPLLASA
jgi:heptosyltransferase-2